LDDYEEGTWTPVLNFGGVAGVTTYFARAAIYTKIGNAVTVTAYFVITTKSAATGGASISGLPFSTKSGTSLFHTAATYTAANLFTGASTAYADPASTSFNIAQTNGSTGSVGATNTTFANNGDFMLTTTYQSS
jgi:hypothetical protein